jgi:mannose-1-phosphate guanylyltransferase
VKPAGRGPVRALVLAAGLGLRLRPLTTALPKPLLPVAGVPLLATTLESLVEIGCEAAAINLHHLGGRIRAAFGARFRGMPLTWSEEPSLLGTLGALGPLRDFFAPAGAVLLVNGDSLCRWPLAELLARHRAAAARGARATLLLAARPDPEAFGGGVGIDARGRVRSLSAADRERGPIVRRLVFAGAHALAPELLARVPAGASDSVRDLYRPLLDAGETLAALITRRRWHDLGTPRRYLDAVDETLAARRSSYVAAAARVAPGVRLRRADVEGGAEIEPDAEIAGALILPGARVGAGAVVRDSIVGFDAVVAAGERVVGALAVGEGAGAERFMLNAGGSSAKMLARLPAGSRSHADDVSPKSR